MWYMTYNIWTRHFPSLSNEMSPCRCEDAAAARRHETKPIYVLSHVAIVKKDRKLTFQFFKNNPWSNPSTFAFLPENIFKIMKIDQWNQWPLLNNFLKPTFTVIPFLTEFSSFHLSSTNVSHSYLMISFFLSSHRPFLL